METKIIYIGFLLLGVSVGFLTFLIFRMGIHQQRFRWSGALSVVASLAGGGYITYLSKPLYFGLYSIGFFLGIVFYLLYLAFGYHHLYPVSRGTRDISLRQQVKDYVHAELKRKEESKSNKDNN